MNARIGLALGVVAIGVGGMIGVVASHPDVLAAHHRARLVDAGGLDLPGTISALPQLPPGITVVALSAPHLLPRQAIDAAEAWSGVSDSDVDPNARAVPVVLNAGLAPSEQNLKVWIVTINRDTRSHGPRGKPHSVSHKLCIAIDDASGQFVLAFTAGKADLISMT